MNCNNKIKNKNILYCDNCFNTSMLQVFWRDQRYALLRLFVKKKVEISVSRNRKDGAERI